jgi:hypothetical protein
LEYWDSIPNFTNVSSYWNTSTSNIDVEVGGVAETTPFTLGIRGTHWAMAGGTSSYSNSTSTSLYSTCIGTTRNWFSMIDSFPAFPFAVRNQDVNSPVCQTAIVCDIIFNGPPTITHATNLTGNNGAITVSATSSHGTVKYSLSDFAYATGGQTSGTFSGLSPGEYKLYAKDVYGCPALINFTILFQPAYTEHYRFVWTNEDISGGDDRTSRLRIYEREYSGDVVEIDNGGTPVFTLRKRKPQGQLNNKFYPIHTTSAEIILMSEVDYQYLPLFTQDNKRFLVVYEVDEGAGYAVTWSGYIVPSVYNEPFIAAPYPVTIQVTDNVQSLQEEDFTDDAGNLLNGQLKLIKVISHILKKTGLSLSIRSGINIFEENHDTDPEDDPLDQTYIDVACYRKPTSNTEKQNTDEDLVETLKPFTCWEVLEAILQPFGARIFQYDNTWIIEEIDRSTDEYAYRLFDANGDYVSNSTFDPVIDIKAPDLTDRVCLQNNDQILEMIPAYGNIDVVSNFNYVGSIITGGFEKSDLLSPETEETTATQGVLLSEDGFRDWQLRENGTDGVSFGRVKIIDSDVVRAARQEDIKVITSSNRSVGAFTYGHEQWSGNLRDAYIESKAKPYQYGPGDEIKLKFDYSSPASPEYEFMVLRFALKLGSLYLQQDLSWGASEHIYRAYPKVSNGFQTFELSVPAPDVSVATDSTIQVRIYFYAKDFYDYGLPSETNDPDDGTDGITGSPPNIDDVVTDGLETDYRLDVRTKITRGLISLWLRCFYELRIDDTAEDHPDIIQAGDYNATTNPRVWSLLKMIIEPQPNGRTRGIDRKFYIDNVNVDALVNGQSPPQKATLSLPISRYVNENLKVDLYNFDCPDIVNAKNMYNNYFRLSDGTPTALWTRSGVAELLSIQQILLKVLGANHSAPTFRLTGSFLSEYFRIGIDNTLRLTKAGSSLSLSNTGFASNLNGWSQTGSGEAFVYSADNSGSAQVTLSGAEDSQKIYQTVSHSGGYITITYQVQAVATSSNDREDVLYVLFFRDSSLVAMEKMTTFAAPTSTTIVEDTYIAFAPSNITRVGFYFKRVAGTGDCTYNVGTFAPAGSDIEEVYQITDYSFDERANSYQLELMQISKSYISLQGTDQGGNNQGDASIGSQFSGAYSSAFGGSFDTVLN